MTDLGVLIDELAARDRCDRCGLWPGHGQSHGRRICEVVRERAGLWDDGWVDLLAVWPACPEEVAEAWPEHRSGPGWRRIFDGFGLRQIDAGQTPWVRRPEGQTLMAVRASVGLHALRPDRSPERVSRLALTMGPAGWRSLARPEGFEVRTLCGGEEHHLSVVGGRLLAIDHPETRPRRLPHRHVVRQPRWEASLSTTGIELLLEGVAVVKPPGELPCDQAVGRWDAGLDGSTFYDLTADDPGWRPRAGLAGLIAAAGVLQATGRAALFAAMISRAGQDLVLDIATTTTAPVSAPTIADHRDLSAVRAAIPLDWLAADQGIDGALSKRPNRRDSTAG